MIGDGEPVGLAEISELLGVPANTVTSWRQRGVLPKARWQLKAGPVWRADEIRAWYGREKDKSAQAAPPDRIAEAIDLSAEPARAEVFAHYGLAMGEAQLVEQHLATVLALLGVPEPYSRGVFLEIMENAEAKTMGQLKGALLASGAPVLGVEHLKRVVDTRNLLAHRYFREVSRSVKMTTDSGRRELIAELDAATRDFHLTAQHLRAAEVRLALEQGVSKHTVMQRVRELMHGRAPETPVGHKAALLVTKSPGVENAVERAFSTKGSRRVLQRLPRRRGVLARRGQLPSAKEAGQCGEEEAD